MRRYHLLVAFLLFILISSTFFIYNFRSVEANSDPWTLGPIRDLSRSEDTYNEYIMPGEMVVSENNVYTAWLGMGYGAPSGSYSVLFAASANNGIRFNTPVNLGNTTGSIAHIIASGSNVYAVWAMSGADTSSSIMFSRSTDNGTSFSDPMEICMMTNSSFDDPAVSVAGTHVYVACKQWDFGNSTDNILFMASSDEGATFSQAETLYTRDIVDIQHLTMTASGSSVFIGWDEQFSPGNYDVLVVGSTDYGASFNSAINLSNRDDSNSSFEPEIAISGSNVYVFYISYYRPSYSLKCRVDLASSSNNGTSFGYPVSSPDTYGNFADLQLYASGGNVFMAWDMSNSGIYGRVYFAKSTDYGATMSTPITLNAPGDLKGSRLPRMAVSGSDVYLAWITESFIPSMDQEGYVSLGEDVYAARSIDSGVNFSDAVDVSNSGEASNPAIAVSGDIEIMSWQDPSLGNEEIFFRVGGTGLTFPDYTISSLPSSLLMRTSEIARSEVTVQSIQGFSDTVDFRTKWLVEPDDGLYYQLESASITPPANGATSTTLTVTTDESPPGSFLLRVTGLSRIDSIVSHLKLSIQIPDFALSVYDISLCPKQSESSTISVRPISGFNDTVSLTAVWVGTQPTGVTFNIAPSEINASEYYSALTVNASALAQTGVFILNVTGTSNLFGIAHSHAIEIEISDFTITAEPDSLSMGSGQKATSIITVESNGDFNDNVDLTTSWIGGTPANVTTQFNSTSVNPYGETAYVKLEITTLAINTNGTYTLRIKGSTWDNTTHTEDISLKITVHTQPPPPPPPGNGTPSIVVKQGNFVSPNIKGMVNADSDGYSPDRSSRVHVYNIGSTNYLYLEREKDQVKIVPDTINPSEWGFGPDNKTFVLLTFVSANQFRISLYDITNNRKVVNDVANPMAWGFSPEGKYFVLDTGSSTGPQYQFQLSVYDIYNNKKTIDMPVISYIPAGQQGDKIKTVGSGFSPDGKTFLLANKNGASTYNLLLLSSTTGNTILSFSNRQDVASFWQFSPGSDLFMFITQAGSTPASTDQIYFYFTSNGNTYTPNPPGQIFIDPSAPKQSAKVAKVGDSYVIQLTGMSESSIPYPVSTTSVSAHSPVNIAVTSPDGLKTGYDPATGGEINQIPGATYSGIGSEPQTVTLLCFDGNYTIEAYGLGNLTSEEPYTLTIVTNAGSGETVSNQTITGNATANSYTQFLFGINEEGNITITDASNVAPTPVILHDITDIDQTTMRLSWTQNIDTDFKNYTIYLSNTAGNLGTQVYTVTDKSATSYVVMGLSPDTTYYFTIRAYDTGELYADSNTVSGKTLAETSTPSPSSPTETPTPPPTTNPTTQPTSTQKPTIPELPAIAVILTLLIAVCISVIMAACKRRMGRFSSLPKPNINLELEP